MRETTDPEITFVLRERDAAAPAAIRAWVAERIRLGLNRAGNTELVEAEEIALAMEYIQQPTGTSSREADETSTPGSVVSESEPEPFIPDVVTVAWLRRVGACEVECARFERIFGPAAPLTRENLRLARTVGLPLSWLVDRFLRKTERYGRYREWMQPFWDANSIRARLFHEDLSDAGNLAEYEATHLAVNLAQPEAIAEALGLP